MRAPPTARTPHSQPRAPVHANRRARADIIRRFRARVDVALPGLYTWFAEGSLHVTVRALVP